MRQAGADPDLEGWLQRFFMRKDEQKQKWKCRFFRSAQASKAHPGPREQVGQSVLSDDDKGCELFSEMIDLGEFEAAQAQDRRRCAACLGEVGSSS